MTYRDLTLLGTDTPFVISTHPYLYLYVHSKFVQPCQSKTGHLKITSQFYVEGCSVPTRPTTLGSNLADQWGDLALGGGGVQGQGKGQRLMTIFGWQHAKVESTKSNPPTPLGSKMLSC